MKEKKRRGLVSLTLFVVCTALLSSISIAFGQDNGVSDPARIKAQALLDRLSPEERVGQLFMVTMDGAEISQDSPILEMIAAYHIGGVLLRRSNNNFTNSPESLSQIQGLVNGLQTAESQSSNVLIGSEGMQSVSNFIPLLIGIEQSGDLYPNNQYFNGLTPIPSQMAIGATWDPKLAEQAGRLAAQELSALGINLIINPSLDVLETPYGEGKGDLGVRTFGGDPYWVGEMGKAYISGLHQGAQGQMAVIAKNFPGRGSSDRLPDEDVATVRKSLEQLKLIELAPFFEVTDMANEYPDAIADGLLLSHIRYQGFQGNIRATTKPVSFDQTAVDLLMDLPEFKGWRAHHGILVSDDLGSEAIRKFFNPGAQPYDARLIARNAFLAGNDLLTMGNLVSTGDTDRFQTYKNTIGLFIQKYMEDPAFAARVDASVLRLLTLKFSLYPDFLIGKILKRDEALDIIGEDTTTVFNITSQAVTLIAPRVDALDGALLEGPGRNERALIFTDVLAAQQCEGCQPNNIIAVNDFRDAILRLYGRAGSAQISDENFLAYSFEELADYVANPFNRPEIDTNLSRADWVIFITHDQSANRPSANALHTLLLEKPEAIRDKNTVLFSLNAPYYYDATEISALTAYFCLYTKVPAAFDIAARVLFRELQPKGTAPVSISGIAYNLLTATSPNPSQVIELSVDQSSADLTEEETEGGLPKFRLGDNLPIRTGVISDQNGHQVPDGTVVRFMLSQQGENLTIQQIESVTLDGIARASFTLIMPGRHEIRVSSEPALNSQIMLIDISEGADAIISAITPTPLPTIGVEGAAPPVEATVEPEAAEDNRGSSQFWRWALVTIIAWVSGFLFSKYATFIEEVRQRVKIALWVVIGGVSAGLWQIVGLPGTPNTEGLAGYLLLTAFLVGVEVVFGLAAWWALGGQEFNPED